MNSQGRQPARLLLVDDDPDDRELTKRALLKGKVKNELFIAVDGEEAMDFLRNQGKFSDPAVAPRPDLILLDLNMPKLNGFEVLRELYGDESLSLIPVIVLTTSKQEEEIVRSYKLGCKSFISKPVDIAEFVKVISQLDQYWFEVVKLPGA